MAPYDSAGKIPRTNFIIASIILFVLSVVSTLGRIVIRLHYQRSLAVDDAFLIFAVVCLTVALGLRLAVISPMYLTEALMTNYPNVSLPSDVLDQVTRFHKLSTTFNVLSFTTIFAVKFSFLFLFRALIRNVRKMSIYWWTVVLMTAAAWAFGVVEIHASRVLGWTAAIIVEDIVTDLMIIVIPVLLIWRIQIKLQQKLALGLTLCLSLIMIITAIVKISVVNTPTNTMDITWGIFWGFMEACVAVIMVSLTAFRSLFVAHWSGVRSPPHRPSLRKRLLNSRLATGRRRAGGDDGEDTEGLPEIPGAALTGMRTFIRGDQAERGVKTSEESGANTELSWPSEDRSGPDD